MSRSAGKPRARGRTTLLSALVVLVSVLLALTSGTAVAAPMHRSCPVACYGHPPQGEAHHASAHHASAAAALLALHAEPLSPDTAGNGASLLGTVIGGLVGAVGTVQAAAPGIVNSTTNVVRTTTGVLTGGRSSAPATPPATPTQAPPPVQPGTGVAAPPPPVAATTPAAVLPQTTAVAQQVPAAPAVAPSPASHTKPRPSSHREGIFDNPAAILTSPGTAILVGLILVFLGLVTAMVLGAGYRGRRSH